MERFKTVAAAPPQGSDDWGGVVEPDRQRTGKHRWRLVEDGVPVWAVILHVESLAGHREVERFSGAVIAETARDFAISPDSVIAAIAYYLENQQSIDALLKVNEEAVS